MGSRDQLFEILAIAGAALGLLALILCAWLAYRLRGVRRAQRVVLGAEERDIVAHAAYLQREFAALRDWLEDATAKIEARMETAETRLDGTIAHHALVRYDAFGEPSGQQSSSIALLDEHRSGVVLSAIRSRNHSHLYVKQLVDGHSAIELSPEERRAVNDAVTRRTPGSVAAAKAG